MRNIFIILAINLVAACSPMMEQQAGQPQAGQQQAGQSSSDKADLKLYALDCGWIDLEDLRNFASRGEYDGRTQKLASPCYLIRHPDGDMIWDLGISDKVNALPKGKKMPIATITVPITMKSQLDQLGLAPDDLSYVAISHSHFDHVGNAYQFTKPTLLIHRDEYDFMFGEGQKIGIIEQKSVAPLRKLPVKKLDGEYDVFGDGRVVIIPSPGHTPGHTVLLVKLKKYGSVMLAGDLYHLVESRKRRIVPNFNFYHDMTLESMQKFEERVKKENAQVIIQHATEHWGKLPRFPGYLD